ncbi:neutral zinc metallopeptidase [Gemmata sp. JC717]|uniref:KPN_02809 family neutral zinc metallopeptidase n=1 Tax=Gemmata algarum TaxID=2975278 RepID=UPI0021BB0B9C|nr:neutral zinc metallopeptidase [Gemmata algarum]MDY3551568.1 neutral zinc metallopeptidase [Gemmata algarum]
MRLDDAPESENVDDRRGMGGKLAVGGGLGGLVIVVLGLLFGVDLRGKLPAPPANDGGENRAAAPKDGYKQFAGKILGLTEEVWAEQFKANGYKSYKRPHMVLFSQGVRTGCGDAPSSVGPFYCPADDTVYLDPTFFDELEQKLGGSKAEFSQAYVVGHEVGHHVQNLLGYSRRTDEMRKTKRENEYSIRLELQADYLAGVWAHHADKKYHILERGDVEAALKTARSIGDNRIQEKMGRRSHPESFNHGTDRQRYAAFSDGLKTGDASKKKLDLYFDDEQTPFDARAGELRNPTLFGR